jgi:ribose-phosphate pyrophosphokinase
MKLFALNSSLYFGEKVAAELGVALSLHEEREFEDGEHKIRPLESVRGQDVYVIQSLHGDRQQSPDDKLCRLLFLIATLKSHGAARVTAVVPYLAYARKDRQTKSHDPVTNRYVAQLFETMGLDRLVVLEAHNVVALQNAFRCETIHLDVSALFVEHAVQLCGDGPIVVASPDPGGVKRAQLFREALEAALDRPLGGAFMEKRRSADRLSGNLLVGEVVNTTVLIIDDLISSGSTMARAAQACQDHGARAVYAMAAHGLFTGEAASHLNHPALTGICITDTMPPFRLAPNALNGRLQIVSATPLIAKTIRVLHAGDSITALGQSSS